MRGYFFLVFVLVVSALLFPVELGSLSYYVLSAFHPGIDIGSSWEMLEMQLWYTAAPLIPFLYAGFLFSWIWAPPVARILPKRMRQHSDGRSESVGAHEGHDWLVAIVSCVVLAFFIGYYAYFHSSNYPLVGTDIYWRNALPAERVLASTSWVAAAAKERHPIVVLGIAVVSKFLGLGVESVLRLAYVALILSFAVVLFLLVFLASGSKTLASFSALVSTVASPTAAGMYTGIVASWVALTIWTLSLVFLFVAKSRGKFLASILGLTFGSLAVLLIHPWTWLGMIVQLIAYPVIVAVLRLKRSFRDFVAVLVAVLCNLGVLAFSLLYMAKTQGWRISEALSLGQNAIGSKYFGFGSWEIIVFFSQIWSQFLNPLFLGLSILGVLVVALRRDRFGAVVLSWIVAASVISIVAAPMDYNPLIPTRGETEIFRAMFLTPFQIPVALGLLCAKSALQRMYNTPLSRWTKLSVVMIVAIAFLAILNGSFRALFPLLSDAHNYPNPLAP